MNNNILIITLQSLMVVGMLSISILLIMPAIPYFNSTQPDAERYALEVKHSLAGHQKQALAQAKKLASQVAGEYIEVIAVGKGTSLLVNSTPYKEDIQLLMDKGVIFSLCQFSLQQQEVKQGHPIETLPGIRLIEDGHGYAENLKNNGYYDVLA